MHRRQFFARLSGFFAVALVATGLKAGYGLVHTGMPRAFTSRVRVFLDGVDITKSRVFAADPRQGWALRLARDARGGAHAGPNGKLMHEIVTGHVELRIA